jgi:hypothetical protein
LPKDVNKYDITESDINVSKFWAGGTAQAVEHLPSNPEALSLNFSTAKKSFSKFLCSSWALVANTCEPSYSGGRDQEDLGSNPAWANSSQHPILKTP